MLIKRFSFLKKFGKGKFLFKENMSKHTTLRVGGKADLLYIPKDLEDFKKVLEIILKERIPYYVLGNGSNVLVSDRGIKGVVLKTSGTLNAFGITKNKLTAWTGANITLLALHARKKSLSGLEFSEGIPGTIGGSLVSNAGTCFGSIAEVLDRVLVLEPHGDEVMLENTDLKFGYRFSTFQEGKYIILKVFLNLKEEDTKAIKEKMEYLKQKRMSSQPNLPNAGSIFKNTDGYSAGYLIDKVGVKGLQVGDALVSPLHANFIVNTGKAKAQDIAKIMKYISKRVYEEFGIKLEQEIVLLGDFS